MTRIEDRDEDKRDQDFAAKHPVLNFIIDLCAWICIWDLIAG